MSHRAPRLGAARVPRRRTVLLTAVTACCLTLASCGGTDSATSTTLSSNARASVLVAQAGATVTVVVPAVATNLNPHVPAGDTPATEMVTALTDPQIFEVDPGLTPELDTNFVQNAELVSVNPETVVYSLNPLATWSDGVPIGVQDFILNWEEQSTSAGSVPAGSEPGATASFDTTSTLGYSDIQTITGSSTGDSVRVVFAHPYDDWDDLFNDLVPAHVATAFGWDDGFSHPGKAVYVSGGPYEVESWVPGSRIVLRRNPRWWGTPGRVATIVVEAGDASQNLSGLISGNGPQVVYSTMLDSSLLQAVSSSPRLDTQESLGTTMLQLQFDVHKPTDESAAVRQGIALELDRQGIVRDLIDPLDPSVQVDDDFLAADSQRSYTRDGLPFDSPDSAEAAVLLTSAGMRRDADGSWISRGSPVVLDLRWASGDPWSELVAPAIEAELVEAGFEVRADPLDNSEIEASQLADMGWDLALVPVEASPYPGQMARVYSTNEAVAGEGVSLNPEGFDAPQVDAVFEQASADLDPGHAATLYQEADRLLWQAMPSIPLFAEPTLLVSSAYVTGVQADAGGPGPLWNAASWRKLGPEHKMGAP
ncbi:MAG: ABC transporter substrate-binding protein [Acidimicrobiales bacterium]